MTENQARITFSIDPEVKKQAKMTALERGVNLTEYLTGLLKEDLKKKK